MYSWLKLKTSPIGPTNVLREVVCLWGCISGLLDILLKFYTFSNFIFVCFVIFFLFFLEYYLFECICAIGNACWVMEPLGTIECRFAWSHKLIIMIKGVFPV